MRLIGTRKAQEPPTPISWQDWGLVACSALHAVLACVTVYWIYDADASQEHFTRRTHFSDWQGLAGLYSGTASYTDGEAMLAQALNIAWCNYTLPPATAWAELCDCVSEQHAVYLNATAAVQAAIPDSLRSAGAAGALSCMRVRPTWRVYPIWSVQTATPVYYVLMVSACFGMASVRSQRLESLGVFFTWGVTVVTLVVMCLVDILVNGMWALAFLSASLVIHVILAPSLRRAPFRDYRCMSCFWFAEFFIAPVFVMLVPIYGAGRDLAFVLCMAVLGGLLGSLGLRSFWYAVAFRSRPQFLQDMRWCAWAGILSLSLLFCGLAWIVYEPSTVYALTGGSVAMLAVTCLVGLLQIPGVPFGIVFPAQVGLSVVRNLALVGLMLYDL